MLYFLVAYLTEELPVQIQGQYQLLDRVAGLSLNDTCEETISGDLG